MKLRDGGVSRQYACHLGMDMRPGLDGGASWRERGSATAIASRGVSHRAVERSTSLKRKVSVTDGRPKDRLPLPAEVGEALVAYVSGGRNPEGARQLFLTCRAPRGPIRADLVGDVVERTCLRAGLPRVGPHRLRHALACPHRVAP